MLLKISKEVIQAQASEWMQMNHFTKFKGTFGSIKSDNLIYSEIDYNFRNLSIFFGMRIVSNRKI